MQREREVKEKEQRERETKRKKREGEKQVAIDTCQKVLDFLSDRGRGVERET